jgi:excisionase family DNA binding protein
MSNVIDLPRGRTRTSTRIRQRPVTYTVDEAAEMLRISRAHAYRCIKAGTLPSLRFGRRIVVPVRAIEALLAKAGRPDSLQT